MENERLRELLHEKVKLLQNISVSLSLLQGCPPDLHTRIMDTLESPKFLNQLKTLQKDSIDGIPARNRWWTPLATLWQDVLPNPKAKIAKRMPKQRLRRMLQSLSYIAQLRRMKGYHLTLAKYFEYLITYNSFLLAHGKEIT
ncbi:hypothetical protein Tco_0609439 [Tanacetum coccineum]